MANLRSIEMMLVDQLFDMHGGYVLDFSDRTFGEFFRSEVNVNIDDPRYSAEGTSKAKRLRYFLQNADQKAVAKALTLLWEYREAIRTQSRNPEPIEGAEGRILALIARLEGKPAPQPAAAAQPTKSAPDAAVVAKLKQELMTITALEPAPRGYAFEKYLTELFSSFGLEPREPFKLRGEQIDGSFQLGHETYLVEAKWEGSRTGVAELHGFHGKLEQKAAWTRGLFVSISGFTEVGLDAFGRGKRMICMDGLDLFEMLERGFDLKEVLERKVRRAAETGIAFTRVRELFGQAR